VLRPFMPELAVPDAPCAIPLSGLDGINGGPITSPTESARKAIGPVIGRMVSIFPPPPGEEENEK